MSQIMFYGLSFITCTLIPDSEFESSSWSFTQGLHYHWEEEHQIKKNARKNSAKNIFGVKKIICSKPNRSHRENISHGITL